MSTTIANRFGDMPAAETAKTATVTGFEGYESRAARAKEAATILGLDWPATIVPEGSALIDVGTEKLEGDRQRWAAMQPAKKTLPVVREALQAESRADYTRKLGDLRFGPGGIVSKSKEGMAGAPYSERVLSQIVGLTVPQPRPSGLGGVLAWIGDDDTTAKVLNPHLSKVREEKEVLIRTKLADDGKRYIRAILSDRYGSVTDIDLAEAIEYALADDPDGLNAKIDYRPGDDHSSFLMVFPSEVPVETFKAGDIHYLAVRVQNSETGAGSVRARILMVRAICVNLTLATADMDVLNMRHVGQGATLRDKVRAALRSARRSLQPLVEAIQTSAKVVLPAEIEIIDAMTAIAKRFGAVEARAKDWAETWEAGYAQTRTAWSLGAAIQEASQGLTWTTAEREQLIASQVMHNVAKTKTWATVGVAA